MDGKGGWEGKTGWEGVMGRQKWMERGDGKAKRRRCTHVAVHLIGKSLDHCERDRRCHAETPSASEGLGAQGQGDVRVQWWPTAAQQGSISKDGHDRCWQRQLQDLHIKITIKNNQDTPQDQVPIQQTHTGEASVHPREKVERKEWCLKHRFGSIAACAAQRALATKGQAFRPR